MRQVILHIGMHKTGSSSIQETLKGYDDGAIRYARLGRGSNHSVPMALLFSSPAERQGHFANTVMGRSREETLALTRRLRRMLRNELAMGRDRLIISGEGLSKLRPKAVARLRAALPDTPQDGSVRVFGYARDPGSFASSALQQRIKSNERRVQGDTSALSVPRPTYRERFGKFVDAFGREAVEVSAFDRRTLHGGSVVSDFLLRCGIDPAAVPEQRSNETMNAAATRLMYDFNRTQLRSPGGRPALAARQTLVRLLGDLDDGPRFALPEDLAAQACEPEDIAWLAETFGIDFPGPGPAPRMPPEEEARRLAAELALRPGDRALRDRLAAELGLDLAPGLPDSDVWQALHDRCLPQ